MDAKLEPGKMALAKGPIVVEESRAQRLQRQQARFRDRGGIFVPSNRNTLADILMGRKAPSPKRVLGRGRSASLSPSKVGSRRLRDGETADEPPQTLRTSPRKAARRDVEEGPSRLLEPSASKASKKPSRKTTAKSKSTPTTSTATTTTTAITAPKKRKFKTTFDDNVAKAPPKRRGRPSKAKPIPDDDDENTLKDDPPSKPKGERSSKPSTKRAKKKAGLVDQMDEDGPQPAPTQPNSKRAAAKRTAANKGSSATEATPSAASTSKSKSKATDKASSANTKAKKTKAAPEGILSTIPEIEDEIDEPAPTSVHDDTNSSRSTDISKFKPAAFTTSKALQKTEVEDAASDEHFPPPRPTGRKGKARASSLKFDEEGEEAKATKYRSTTSKRARALDAAGEKGRATKRSKLEPEMIEEDKDEPPPRMNAKAKSKTKAVNPDNTRPRGRGGKDSKGKVEDESELPSPRKKRERDLEDMDAPGRLKRAKVERHTGEADLQVPEVEAEDAKDGGKEALKKAAAKRATAKVSASKSQAKPKPSSRSPSKPKAASKSTSKSKPSTEPRADTDIYIKLKSSGPENGKIIRPKLQPRKSVMRRIKEPLPPMEDDDPDPIDCLR